MYQVQMRQYESNGELLTVRVAARVIIYVLLSIKVALSIALVHYGVGYMAQSSSKEELLLNAVSSWR